MAIKLTIITIITATSVIISQSQKLIAIIITQKVCSCPEDCSKHSKHQFMIKIITAVDFNIFNYLQLCFKINSIIMAKKVFIIATVTIVKVISYYHLVIVSAIHCLQQLIKLNIIKELTNSKRVFKCLNFTLEIPIKTILYYIENLEAIEVIVTFVDYLSIIVAINKLLSIQN